MNRRKACLLIAASPAAAAGAPAAHSDQDDRPWLGPEVWSNPLQDWRLRNGRIECFVSGRDRNVVLPTHGVTDQPGAVSMRVRLGRLEDDSTPLQKGFVGFRLGIHGRLNDYRDSALYGIGVYAGLAWDGRLLVGKLEADAPRAPEPFQNLELRLDATQTGATCQVRVAALDAQGKVLAEITRSNVPSQWLTGGVALVCSSGEIFNTPDDSAVTVTMSGINKRASERGGNMRFWFRNWTVSGSRVQAHEDRAWGPILFAMHT